MGNLLFVKRTVYRPTLLAWLITILLIVLLGWLLFSKIYSFLAIDETVEAKTLVIEGFVPKYALKEAIDLYHKDGYENLVVTGISITNNECASLYFNTADASIAALKDLGFTDTIYAARITENIYIDRTYNTALATKLIFENNEKWSHAFNVFSIGVHAKRSRMMFREALGDDYRIGVIAYPDRSFNPDKWWENSKGFRNVSNELVATLFVSLFFHPNETESLNRLEEGHYVELLKESRVQKELVFGDSLKSPFNAEELAKFHGFNYYDPDLDFKISSQFLLDTSSAPFKMPTTTSRTPEYRIYGYLHFYIGDSLLQLTAYQNMKYRKHPEYGGQLFVPFTDLTNGFDSYGAGRYIDIPIPTKDTISLDFNRAYNPYCAYYDRWSCPLVPFDNHLSVEIRAGEKKFKDDSH